MVALHRNIVTSTDDAVTIDICVDSHGVTGTWVLRNALDCKWDGASSRSNAHTANLKLRYRGSARVRATGILHANVNSHFMGRVADILELDSSGNARAIRG